ncbi:MAG: GTP-binding protein [Acidobacteriota bacterium]
MANRRDALTRRARARYAMIGGFLGAGKSTAVGQLARRLTGRGLSVGLITNDQGRGLVDTQSLRRQGFPVEEIAGGCFCCRFSSLEGAVKGLESSERPDLFIAEPVGSCTDLVATVSYPLRRLYGDRFDIAPLSVMVDPVRAARVLGLEAGRHFSPKVSYVYRKQLEEAHVLVINKIDLLAEPRRRELRQALEARYPQARLFEVSARSGEGLDAWFEDLETRALPDPATASGLEIDYATYGEGEALLGWLNATLAVEAASEFDGSAWLEAFARGLQQRLIAAEAEVAHLKMTLAPEHGVASAGAGDLAQVHLVHHDFVPELAQRLAAPVERAQLVVNLRAEASPQALEGVLRAAAAESLEARLEHVESFRPGQPRPTHRETIPSGALSPRAEGAAGSREAAR